MDYTSAIAELLSQHGFHRFMMSRTKVGHLRLVGHLDDRRIDIVLDTGAASTVVDLNYCQSEEIAVMDTGQIGGGGVEGRTHHLYTLSDVRLTLEGLPIHSDGIFAMDLSLVNQKLMGRGADRIHAILGADVLRYHQAVIDYATLALFLKEEPAFPSDPESVKAAARMLAVRGYTATQISHELQKWRGLDVAEADKVASIVLAAKS